MACIVVCRYARSHWVVVRHGNQPGGCTEEGRISNNGLFAAWHTCDYDSDEYIWLCVS